MKGAVIIAFLSGAVVGAAAMWKFAERKWHLIADEEIKSVKMAYKEKYSAPTPEDLKAVGEAIQAGMEEGIKKERLVPHPVVQGKTDDGKTNYHTISQEAIKDNIDKPKLREFNREKADIRTEPYIIDGKDFGEYDEYSQIALIYDIDKGKLIEEETEKELELVETLGEEVIDFIANDEETNVYHVRNELLRIDYEIQVI